MSREDFVDLCGEARMRVDDLYTFAEGKLEGYAVRYMQAWERFTTALTDARVSERLVGNAIWNALLAFVPGGIGGVAGRMLTDRGHGAFLADGVKDLVKDALRRGGDHFASAPGYEPLGDKPEQWRGTMMENLKTERTLVGLIVTFWMSKANARSSTFALDFDPVERIQRALTVAGSPILDLPAATDRDAWLYEKALWRAWVDSYRYHLLELRSSVGVAYQVADRMPAGLEPTGGVPALMAGRVIRKRLHALGRLLGESADDWLEQWGADSRRKLEARRDALNADAHALKRLLDWLLD
jgi:hypothetical protein